MIKKMADIIGNYCLWTWEYFGAKINDKSDNPLYERGYKDHDNGTAEKESDKI